MSPTELKRLETSAADPALRAGLETGLERPLGPETARIAEYLAGALGPTAVALVHYGSHVRPEDARPESAHDFFVIVDRYLDAYRSLRQRGAVRFSPRLAALLNRFLPPNVISVTAPPGAAQWRAKCAVLSLGDLVRACSARARDHFAQARLLQDVRLVWSRDPSARAQVLEALVQARLRTFAWGRTFLPPRFDVRTYCHVLLAASYASEIRPEGTERAAALLAAQRDVLVPAYTALLGYLAAHRVLSPEGDVYRDLDPPGRVRKWLTRLYFTASKLRSTLRWLKYVALYEGWLDYVVAKVERRSGESIRLTPWERRLPLIFLWPRTLRFLVARRRRR